MKTKKLKLAQETVKVLTNGPTTCSMQPTTTVQTSNKSRCC
ncbi:MAG TPA: hypothetical protein VGM88_19865 [Kofleriaceae bacterium]|jgi:hypothetical protein